MPNERMSEDSSRKFREHVLVTLLGTNPRPACYVLDGDQSDARFAPVALVNLLAEDDRPDRVLALCTPEAMRDSWPLLQEDLGADGYELASMGVPSGHARTDVNEFLATLCQRLTESGRRVDLTLDVTHGLRHFSFLAYTAVLYLEALGAAGVRGAYYGLLAKDKPSPFFDLRPLLELPQWVYAMRVLRDTGSAMPMAAAVRTAAEGQSASEIARCLDRLSEAYLSGLPLELGRCARDILQPMRMKPLRRLLAQSHRLPLTEQLIGQLRDSLEAFALPDPIAGQGWKAKVALSKGELERQAAIVDKLLDHGGVPTALRLMHEWTVSWVVWRIGEGDDWLDYAKARRGAGSLLGATRKLGEDPKLRTLLTEDQMRLGRFWGDLSDLRNAYAHHGMRRQDLLDRDMPNARCRIREVWNELRVLPDWSVALERPGGRVLVSPIGRRPGVLFSALEACRGSGNGAEVSACLVICSAETETLIEDAAAEAGYAGRVERLSIDPHGGRGEIGVAVETGRRHLVGADEVVVNVTGGTTVMGLAAEELAAEAKRFARPVRRFGLIDRRPPTEQDADPYQVGEPFWLDPEEDGSAEYD